MKLRIKSIGIAILIIVLTTIFEQLISGNGIEWFKSLEKPPILVPLQIFYTVAGILGFISVFVLSRLFELYFKTKSSQAKLAIVWIVTLMLANGLWNYFFMGLENLRNGFIGMLIFLPILLITLVHLRKIDKISFWLYFMYLFWVIYDVIWTYQLWKLNSL